MDWLSSVFSSGQNYNGGGLWSMTNSQGSDPHSYSAAGSYGSYGHSIMQGTMTSGRMISTMMSGFSKYNANSSAASFADLSFDQEAKASEERARSIREQTLSIAASQRVGLAASGVDITSGTAANIATNTVRKGAHNLDIERDNAKIRMQKSGYRAAQYRSRGTNALLGAGVKAFGQYKNYKMDLYQRG